MTDKLYCPLNCGGLADNGHDRCVPPNPYICTKCMASYSRAINDDVARYSYQLADQMIEARGDKSG